jgi:hypothetical protein
MNIPPFLERLLLSNEATFKNASLGLSGQNFIDVPKGKSAVILEIEIMPFVNDVSTLFQQFLVTGRIDDNVNPIYESFTRRLMFQLQVINDTYATYFSFQNQFEINWQALTVQDTKDHLLLNFSFNGFKEDVFIYTDRSMYFNFIYPYLETEGSGIVPGFGMAIGTPLANFTSSVQSIPNHPITFRGNNTLNFVIGVLTNGLPSAYYSPTGRNIVNGDAAPLREYFQLQADNTPVYPEDVHNSIMQPVVDGEQYANFLQLLTQPFVNVKYALINKRAADYGLTTPKA